MKLKKRKFKPLGKEEKSIRRDEVFKIVFGKNENKKYLKDLLYSGLMPRRLRRTYYSGIITHKK